MYNVYVYVLPRCNARILHALQRATFVRKNTHTLLLLYTYTLFTYRPLYDYLFLKGLNRLLLIYLQNFKSNNAISAAKACVFGCPLTTAPNKLSLIPATKDRAQTMDISSSDCG